MFMCSQLTTKTCQTLIFETADHVQFQSLTQQQEKDFLDLAKLEVHAIDIDCNFSNVEEFRSLINSISTKAPNYDIFSDPEEENGRYPSGSLPPLSEFQPYIPGSPVSRLSQGVARVKIMKHQKKKKQKQAPLQGYIRGNRSNSETGFRGVRFSTNGLRFRATVNYNKKPFNVGTFSSAEEAAHAYDRLLVKITRGKEKMRNRLNFPENFDTLKMSLGLSTDNHICEAPPRIVLAPVIPKKVLSNRYINVKGDGVCDEDYIYESDYSDHESFDFSKSTNSLEIKSEAEI